MFVCFSALKAHAAIRPCTNVMAPENALATLHLRTVHEFQRQVDVLK